MSWFFSAWMNNCSAPFLSSMRISLKLAGDADPSLTYQVSGLKNGDTAGSILTGGLNRAAGENVGVYGINQGDLRYPPIHRSPAADNRKRLCTLRDAHPWGRANNSTGVIRRYTEARNLPLNDSMKAFCVGLPG